MSKDQPSRRELTRMKNDQLHTLALSRDITPGEDWQKADYIQAIIGDPPEDEDETDDTEETEEDAQGPEQGDHPVGRSTSGKSSLRGQPKYHLLVNSEDGPGGQEAVEVSVNGYLFRIPRDKWVVVPYPVVEVLNNAVNTRLERKGTDEIGRPILEERHARRYSFQSMPAQQAA